MTAIHVASGGHGNNPTGNKCAAEWRFALCRCERCNAARAAGTLLTDAPPCSPATIAHAIPVVNDRLTQAGRDRLASRIPLIPSIAADADPAVVERVERLVALWCARSVEHLSNDPRVKACNDTTERWLAGEASDAERAAEAAGAAWAAWAAGAAWAAEAARAARAAGAAGAAWAAWAAEAARAAGAAGAAWAAWAAEAAGAAGAARAAWAAEAARDDALLDWLDRLMEVWNKTAAAEGLLGSCDWLDPDVFTQAGGS